MKPIVLSLSGIFIFLSGCATSADSQPRVQHLNPAGLHKNPAFSQAVAVQSPHTTIYVGEQNAVDADGKVVGKGELATRSPRCSRT